MTDDEKTAATRSLALHVCEAAQEWLLCNMPSDTSREEVVEISFRAMKVNLGSMATAAKLLGCEVDL